MNTEKHSKFSIANFQFAITKNIVKNIETCKRAFKRERNETLPRK